MGDLEFLQDRTDERSTPRADGIDFVERGERAKNSDERPRGDRKPLALIDQCRSEYAGVLPQLPENDILEPNARHQTKHIGGELLCWNTAKRSVD